VGVKGQEGRGEVKEGNARGIDREESMLQNANEPKDPPYNSMNSHAPLIIYSYLKFLQLPKLHNLLHNKVSKIALILLHII